MTRRAPARPFSCRPRLLTVDGDGMAPRVANVQFVRGALPTPRRMRRVRLSHHDSQSLQSVGELCCTFSPPSCDYDTEGRSCTKSACKGEVAVWISHGNADNVVMTSYGQQSREFWVARNKCNAMMSMPVSPAPCVEYLGCTAGLPVRYCEYDGDHNLMPMSAQTIWAFFKQF